MFTSFFKKGKQLHMHMCRWFGLKDVENKITVKKAMLALSSLC